MTEVAVQRASGRGIWGWMFFDWAAQPFFTVVTTFIFGPYFVSRMASDPAAGQAAWGYAIAAAGFVTLNGGEAQESTTQARAAGLPRSRIFMAHAP